MKTIILVAALAIGAASAPAQAAKSGTTGDWYSTSDGVQSGSSAVVAARYGIRLADETVAVRDQPALTTRLAALRGIHLA